MRKCSTEGCPYWHGAPGPMCWTCQRAAYDRLTPEEKWKRTESFATAVAGTALGPAAKYLAELALVEAFPAIIMTTTKGEA